MSDPEVSEGDQENGGESTKFLAAMSALEGGRRRFLHDTDHSQVLDKPFSELTGGVELTVASLLSDLNENPTAKKKRLKKKKKDLTGSLESDLSLIYKNSVLKAKDSLKLKAKLDTPQAAEASRKAIYTKNQVELKKWDSVIHSRRAASTVSFPLEKPDMRLKSVEQHVNSHFTPRTPLEAEVMRALHGDIAVVDSTTSAKAAVGLSFKEQWQQMQDMARLKAHIRYQEAKLARRNKIKSKTYRRHHRRQKAKEAAKELEELRKSHPELAEQKESELQSDRVLERATLKHSRKSSANKKIRFHVLAQKKSGDKNESQVVKAIANTMASRKKELMTKDAQDEDDSLSDDDQDNNELSESESKGIPLPSVNVDVLLSEEKNPWMSDGVKPADANLVEMAQLSAKRRHQDAAIDPRNFVQVKRTNVLKVAPDVDDDDEGDDQDIDEDRDKREQIGEIFAEDDLVAEEFAAEKEAEAMAKKKKRRKMALEMSLPGWGTWSGSTVASSSSSSKAQRKMAQKNEEAKGVNRQMPHIIMRDDKASLRPMQTVSLPFPFTSVADYEASLRTPLGQTFIPRTSFDLVTKPKVTAQLGATIEAMDKEVLVRRGVVDSTISVD